MKCQTVLPACLLLLWALTASAQEIFVKKVSDGIVLTCDAGKKQGEITRENDAFDESRNLPYNDDYSGEYQCVEKDSKQESSKIFVKFRTCDTCIELDVASIIGLVVGNVVATTVMGVAVYLVASQTRIGPVTSHKKSSDRQRLVSNEVSNRGTNDHYQPLKPKSGQRDTYDVLTNRR